MIMSIYDLNLLSFALTNRVKVYFLNRRLIPLVVLYQMMDSLQIHILTSIQNENFQYPTFKEIRNHNALNIEHDDANVNIVNDEN